LNPHPACISEGSLNHPAVTDTLNRQEMEEVCAAIAHPATSLDKNFALSGNPAVIGTPGNEERDPTSARAMSSSLVTTVNEIV
jgi:hypothetical protein